MNNRASLCQFLDALLKPENFNDYCPNGLQIEGKESIRKVITGVTASLRFIEEAINANADVLLVHHGFFWKGENACLTGIKKKRIELILKHDLNLIAYHLPLDFHPEVGNNIQLAKIMGWTIDENSLQVCPWGLVGSTMSPLKPAEMSELITSKLGRTPLHIGPNAGLIERIAWCTGGAQNYFEQAIDLGVDAFITGEISEKHVHIARETGVHFFSAGHHATERYGVQAVGHFLQQTFNIEHQFIDVDSPV